MLISLSVYFKTVVLYLKRFNMVEIITFDKGHRDSRFYNFVGKLALDRNVTKELHDIQYGSVYDEIDTATWLLASIDNVIVGCCAFYDRGKYYLLDNTYVLKQFRGLGIGSLLFSKRFELARSFNKTLKVITKNPIQAHIYEKYGFQLTSKRGKYLWYSLNIPMKALQD